MAEKIYQCVGASNGDRIVKYSEVKLNAIPVVDLNEWQLQQVVFSRQRAYHSSELTAGK